MTQVSIAIATCDFVEERTGTSAVISDTDGDGLTDNIEVNGFDYAGKHWFTNPEMTDSNGDGLGDALEWGWIAMVRTTPLDSDNDGLPISLTATTTAMVCLMAGSIALYSRWPRQSSPMQLTLNHLSGKPTFVEFQLRPQDDKQLWYAFNTLDWPQDNAGQMRCGWQPTPRSWLAAIPAKPMAI